MGGCGQSPRRAELVSELSGSPRLAAVAESSTDARQLVLGSPLDTVESLGKIGHANSPLLTLCKLALSTAKLSSHGSRIDRELNLEIRAVVEEVIPHRLGHRSRAPDWWTAQASFVVDLE
jgi:hypothetical protein